MEGSPLPELSEEQSIRAVFDWYSGVGGGGSLTKITPSGGGDRTTNASLHGVLPPSGDGRESCPSSHDDEGAAHSHTVCDYLRAFMTTNPIEEKLITMSEQASELMRNEEMTRRVEEFLRAHPTLLLRRYQRYFKENPCTPSLPLQPTSHPQSSSSSSLTSPTSASSSSSSLASLSSAAAPAPTAPSPSSSLSSTRPPSQDTCSREEWRFRLASPSFLLSIQKRLAKKLESTPEAVALGKAEKNLHSVNNGIAKVEDQIAALERELKGGEVGKETNGDMSIGDMVSTNRNGKKVKKKKASPETMLKKLTEQVLPSLREKEKMKKAVTEECRANHECHNDFRRVVSTYDELVALPPVACLFAIQREINSYVVQHTRFSVGFDFEDYVCSVSGRPRWMPTVLDALRDEVNAKGSEGAADLPPGALPPLTIDQLREDNIELVQSLMFVRAEKADKVRYTAAEGDVFVRTRDDGRLLCYVEVKVHCGDLWKSDHQHTRNHALLFGHEMGRNPADGDGGGAPCGYIATADDVSTEVFAGKDVEGLRNNPTRWWTITRPLRVGCLPIPSDIKNQSLCSLYQSADTCAWDKYAWSDISRMVDALGYDPPEEGRFGMVLLSRKGGGIELQ